ncbi:MAG: ABC transporter ATP-binding protein [Bacteroidota bacterium]
MSNSILEIRCISKKFKLKHELTPYLSLRERLGQLIRFDRHTGCEDFWALKDIDFDVSQGDSVAIVGKNGAGKSTLLKILSRITPPTQGTITARGRMASLLEVGTGFHPELTGRENIFLNGSILGMRRAEINSKLDEIIDFSGVEKFLDTPLKHYSSGMQLRLAFAVAAFLEPEILIIDEVLAVGDAEFQRKCLGKMDEVTKSGRTILFVSHNMGAIRSLCKRAILLHEGSVVMNDTASRVVESYLSSVVSRKKNPDETKVSTCNRIEMRTPIWLNGAGKPTDVIPYGDNPHLQFKLHIKDPVKGCVLGIGLDTIEGNRIFTSHSIDDPDFGKLDFEIGYYTIDSYLDLPSLAPGIYNITYGIKDHSGATLLYSENDLQLEIGFTQKMKDGDKGILWHTGSWKISAT